MRSSSEYFDRARPRDRRDCCGRTSSSTPRTSSTRTCSTAGPPAFTIRATLAATLSPSWGVYAGFELYEHVAVRPGSEEYLDSEKYELQPARLGRGRGRGPHRWRRTSRSSTRSARAAPGPAAAAQPRRSTTATTTRSCATPRPATGERRRARASCNLDPHGTRETTVRLDMPALGLDWDEHVRRCTTRSPGDTCGWGQRQLRAPRPVRASPRHVLHVRRSAPRDRTPTGPSTPDDRDPDWFKRAVFYEVLVRAFDDANGDGIGDLRGLTEQARLPAVARRRLPLAAAVLRLAAARRRLRRRATSPRCCPSSATSATSCEFVEAGPRSAACG